MLEIMRDSRIGAHGAAGVTLLLVAKVAALSGVLAQPRGAALLLFPGAARCAVVPCVAWFRYARDTGLGAPFRQARPANVAGAALIFGLVAASVDAARALPAAAVALVIALALSTWVGRRLGGLTGDVYGAAIELAEIAFLTAWLALG